jgi:hypothetical protein
MYYYFVYHFIICNTNQLGFFLLFDQHSVQTTIFNSATIFKSLFDQYLIIVLHSDPGNVFHVSTKSINIIQVQDFPTFALAYGFRRPIAT